MCFLGHGADQPCFASQDVVTTAGILAAVRDILIHQNLKDSQLMWVLLISPASTFPRALELHMLILLFLSQ